MTPAAAPLVCLSRYTITRTVSDVVVTATPSGSLILNLQLMLRRVHFRPIRWTSVTPCAIMLMLAWAIVPFVAIVASSISRSWNFSSPPGPNRPKNPETRVNPLVPLLMRGLNRGLNDIRWPFRPVRIVRARRRAAALSIRWLAINPSIFCHIFVEVFLYLLELFSSG